MKKQVFFIHGGDAFSQHKDFLQHLKITTIRNLPSIKIVDVWSKTLAEDLGNEYEVFMPIMPNKQNAVYEEWSIWFERHFTYLRDDIILIGWSLGGMFLAKYLAENDLPFVPKTVFLMSAPCGQYESVDGNDCGTFQFGEELLGSLASKDLSLQIWHSKDDFVVPFKSALAYETALSKAKTYYFEDKNHFLITDFPELISAIINESVSFVEKDGNFSS